MRGRGDHDGDARARFTIFLCSRSSDDVVNELVHNAGGAEDSISCRLRYEKDDKEGRFFVHRDLIHSALFVRNAWQCGSDDGVHGSLDAVTCASVRVAESPVGALLPIARVEDQGDLHHIYGGPYAFKLARRSCAASSFARWSHRCIWWR